MPFRHLRHELPGSQLRPLGAALAIGHETYMAAPAGYFQEELGMIFSQFKGITGRAQKGIVGGADQQCRPPNPRQEAQAAVAHPVIFRIEETVI